MRLAGSGIPSEDVSACLNQTRTTVTARRYDLYDRARAKRQAFELWPEQVALYRKWGADRIIAEANQGGAMVETTVRTVDANASFEAVHASRGKITRAEPIAALAEQFRIHLVGAFPELEDQLCTFEAGPSASPDRLDAMVWALTELMIENQNDGIIRYYQENAAIRLAAAPAASFRSSSRKNAPQLHQNRPEAGIGMANLLYSPP